MIDDPVKTESLLDQLKENLPFTAILSPSPVATLRERSAFQDVPPRGEVTLLHYAGDEGGIICRLDLGIGAGGNALFTSITHLLFDRQTPMAREIAAYQKHRIKKLRRQGIPL